MTVKEFRHICNFDYIRIVYTGDLLDIIDFDTIFCQYDDMEIVAISPVHRGHMAGKGIEVEIDPEDEEAF